MSKSDLWRRAPSFTEEGTFHGVVTKIEYFLERTATPNLNHTRRRIWTRSFTLSFFRTSTF